MSEEKIKNSDDRELIVPAPPGLIANLEAQLRMPFEREAYDKGFDTGQVTGFDDACRWVLDTLRGSPVDEIRDAIRDCTWLGKQVTENHAAYLARAARIAVIEFLEAKMDAQPAERPQ